MALAMGLVANAWLSHSRHLSTDDERLPASSEAWIYLAMSRLMLRRLARS
jgi:putative transposase